MKQQKRNRTCQALACAEVQDNGIKKKAFVHMMVAEAFVPNPNNYTKVRHKDGNTLNNKANNLEWYE